MHGHCSFLQFIIRVLLSPSLLRPYIHCASQFLPCQTSPSFIIYLSSLTPTRACFYVAAIVYWCTSSLASKLVSTSISAVDSSNNPASATCRLRSRRSPCRKQHKARHNAESTPEVPGRSRKPALAGIHKTAVQTDPVGSRPNSPQVFKRQALHCSFTPADILQLHIQHLPAANSRRSHSPASSRTHSTKVGTRPSTSNRVSGCPLTSCAFSKTYFQHPHLSSALINLS